MITLMLAIVFFSIVDFVLAIAGTFVLSLGIPATLPANITNSFTLVAPLWNQLQNIFPMDTLLTILQLVIATEAVILVLRAFLWILKKIPGIS